MNEIETGPKFEGDRQIRWDASSIDKAASCHLLYKRSYIDGLRARAGPWSGGARGWGSVMHAGLDEYDRAKALQPVGVGSLLPLRAGIQAMVATGFNAAEENARTLGTAIRALVWYDDQYKDEIYKTSILPNGEPAIEVRFELPIPGTDYRFSGRMDRIVNVGEETFIMEHKTTITTLGSYFFDRYHPSFQTGAYCWAARELFGQPASGVIIDAIQTAVGFTRCARQTVTLSPSQLDEWFDAVRYQIDAVERARESGKWQPNFAACNNYGGCDYRSIDALPPEFRSALIESEFTKGEHT